MYPTQQVAYSLKNRHRRHFQYHAAAKTDNNDLFLIGNQHLTYSSLPSMHQKDYYLQHGSHSTSSSPIRSGSHLLPTTGHTLHWIDNALVSFFGKPNQSAVTIIKTKHSSSYISSIYQVSSSTSPSIRYAHTTTSIRNKNNTTDIYLIGGSAIENDEPLGDIWKLDWESKAWIDLTTSFGSFVSGMMGHVALSLPQHPSTLMTCFGVNPIQRAFFQHCTLFNTNSAIWKRIEQLPSTLMPAPRIHTSMILANRTHAILYGGISSTSALLDDLWWVDLRNVNSTNNTIMFTPLAHSIPRAGHVALMVSDSLMLVDGGQYDGSLENERTILDLASLDSSSALGSIQKRDSESRSPAEEVARDSIQSSPSSSSQGSSISGGAIGGIIVAVVLTLGITITLFVFYQRRQRRQRNYDLYSRTVRFSLSTPPRPSESYIEQQQQQQQRSSIIQHPEAAKTRLSHMSFGSEFHVGLDIDGSRSSASSHPAKSKPATASTSSITPPKSNISNNHPNMLDSPSRQLYTNWVCETPVPPSAIAATTSSEYNLNNTALDPRHTSMYVNQSTSQNSAGFHHEENNDDDDDEKLGAKKRSSTALKRLRLSIFKPLDIGSSISEQQQQQSRLSRVKTDLGGPSLSSLAANHHGAIDSDHQPTTSNSNRRSSMFGLSRFLNIGDSTTEGEEHNQHQDAGDHNDGGELDAKQHDQVYPPYHRHHYQAEARASLGSKSVASLQWVEFNNDMDFDSGVTSRHLAVMNHHRQSAATISSSSGFGSASVDDLSLGGSKPTSPRNTLIMSQQQQQPSFYQRSSHHHHPSSSSSSYRLGQRELQSWEDARISRLGTSPPSSHHRLSVTRDPTKTNSFPTLAPLNID